MTACLCLNFNPKMFQSTMDYSGPPSLIQSMCNLLPQPPHACDLISFIFSWWIPRHRLLGSIISQMISDHFFISFFNPMCLIILQILNIASLNCAAHWKSRNWESCLKTDIEVLAVLSPTETHLWCLSVVQQMILLDLCFDHNSPRTNKD